MSSRDERKGMRVTNRNSGRAATGRVNVQYVNLGLTAYAQALQAQRRWHAWCVARWSNVLLLTQHQPVITLGYRRPWEQVKLSAAQLQEKGLSVEYTDRGGGATYHAPGQLVVYPIFSSLLHQYGVRSFIRQLEEGHAPNVSPFWSPNEPQGRIPWGMGW